MPNISLNEIADKIIEAILEERYINKESLKALIKPILKIWFYNTNYSEKEKPISEYQRLIYDREFQCQFWKDKIKNHISKDQLEMYYRELNDKLIDAGFIKK